MYAVHGVLNQIVGGWRITTIMQARSGIPFTPVVTGNINGGDLALSGSPSCFCGYALYPNRVGSGKISNPTINQWFDPTAFAPNILTPDTVSPSFGFGDSGRNALRGPRFVDVDLSFGKSFRIREGMSFEIRADSYNAFNHPQFNNPDTNLSYKINQDPITKIYSVAQVSTTVGKITSLQGANNFGPGRIFQLGGRFSF